MRSSSPLQSMSSISLFFLVASFFFLRIHCSPLIQAAISQSQGAYYNCTRNSTFAANSAYRSNVKILLDWLSSNGTNHTRFYNTRVVSNNATDTVYGLFYCKKDIPPDISKSSLTEAAKVILSLCTKAKEAIIWYGVCYVHYSDRNFSSTVEESPKLTFMNEKDYVGEVGRFNTILWDMLNDMSTKAADDSNKLAEMAVNITPDQTVYGSAWCLPYLSTEDCKWCLIDAIAEVKAVCCKGKSGGRILFPSCGIRYELYPFLKEHNIVALEPPPPPPLSKSPRPPAPPGTGKIKQKKSTTITIVFSVVVALVLLLCCCCFLHRKERKNQDDILKEIFGNSTLESLRFELAKIEAATNRFATENRVGKGGFGEVYKGILPHGQEIAVKRLIGSSKQGAEEFKNEVLVIAKLQHRNLVRLLGFCLEGEEKILIYEYVSNKSLDYFLLDPQKQRLLSWFERQKIITGIARGILYLHEDSRLKIIHRDLKPSNILLDSNMNPKISDFGMARIVADQTEESTHRIVGTYGYMSPEYALYGQFSVKSDIYSFGVVILEIISGKKKGRSFESEHIDDIRRHAWTKWTEQTPLELLDPNMEGPYSKEEVIKCIHIGLLCVQEDPNDRPTMAKIVFYLNSHSLNLPSPHEPIFFKRSRTEDNMTSTKESVSNSDSMNGITLTKFLPR